MNETVFTGGNFYKNNNNNKNALWSPVIYYTECHGTIEWWLFRQVIIN